MIFLVVLSDLGHGHGLGPLLLVELADLPGYVSAHLLPLLLPHAPLLVDGPAVGDVLLHHVRAHLGLTDCATREVGSRC